MSVTSRLLASGLLLVVVSGCGSGPGGGAGGGSGGPATGGSGAAGLSPAAPLAELPTLAVQATIGGLEGVANMTSTADAVWALAHSSATLARIDPKTNKTTATIALGAGYANGLGLAGGRLWTFEQTAGEVLAIDPRTAKVVETVKLGSDGDWFWVGDEAAWLLSGGAISRIDGATAKVTTHQLDISCEADGVAAGGGFVWIASAGGGLCKVDEKTGAILARGSVAGSGQGMAIIGGRPWIAGPDGGVTIVDPATLAVASALPAPSSGLFEGGTYSLGNADGDNTVIVGNPDGTGGWVRYTGATIGRATGSGHPSIILFAGLPPATFAGGVLEAFGSVWVANFAGSSVQRSPLPGA
jgi:hypothetical protein